MLKIRLSRTGKHKTPFFRVVLTEHTNPVKSGYKLVLGRYDPLKHISKIDAEKVKEWIAKWAQPSNRVAKLLKKETNDTFWDKYITLSTAHRKPKNAPEEEETKEEKVKEEAPEQTEETKTNEETSQAEEANIEKEEEKKNDETTDNTQKESPKEEQWEKEENIPSDDVKDEKNKEKSDEKAKEK